MSHAVNHTGLFQLNFDSLEGLADRIAEIMNCPITIEDSNHHIISYSSHEDSVDNVRVNTIIQRKVPEKVINSLWKKGFMSKLFKDDKPVKIPAIPEVGLGDRIAISVSKNNEILGFIWAHTNGREITEENYMMLTEAAKAVQKKLLKLQIKKQRMEESYKEFFWQLLTGHLKDSAEIEQQAQKYGLYLNGYVAIAMIEFEEEVTEEIEKHSFYLTETLRGVEVVCKVFDQNQFILLVRFPTIKDSNKILKEYVSNFTAKIEERLKLHHNISAAFGLIFDSPKYIKDSYNQAERVLNAKSQFQNQLEKVYGYNELGVYQFIDELKEIRKQTNYKNDVIKTLKQYDENHNTELLKTLKAFLNCDSNVYKAANVIHVHTNTLNYRLKRITELTDIDLKDPNQKVTLFLDLKLLEM